MIHEWQKNSNKSNIECSFLLKGFDSIFSSQRLRIFYPEEIEKLLCHINKVIKIDLTDDDFDSVDNAAANLPKPDPNELSSSKID